jgi:hypothetical protein
VSSAAAPQWHIPGRTQFTLLLCVMVLCSMHLLRNVSLVFPAAYFGAGCALLLVSLRRLKITIPQLLILGCYGYIALLSLVYAPRYGSPVTGLARLCYLAPLVLYMFGTRLSDAQAAMVWKLLALFTLASAASILYQVVFGAIPWFAEASERAGTTRFGSLAGSLTVFGSIVGPACFLVWLLLRRTPGKVAMVLLLLLASALSLQKAAIAGAVLGTLIGIVSTRDRAGLISLAKAGVTLGAVALLLFWIGSRWLPADLQHSIVVFLGGALGSGGSDDYSILESLQQRFQEVPMIAVDFFGASSLILGVGVFGASGALGYPDLPMMHNLLGELLIVGGIGVFLLFLFNTFVCALRALAWIGSGRREALRIKLASGVYLLTILVGLNTGSIHFHPVVGLFYWFSMRELTVDWMRWRRLRSARRTAHPAAPAHAGPV